MTRCQASGRRAMVWDDMAVVGRIARAHGNRGEVILDVETDFPRERFRPGEELFIHRAGEIVALLITAARFHRERPVLAIEGVTTISAAEKFAGSELRIPADRLQPLPSGTFYRHDLVGCRVETRGGLLVGVVREVEGSVVASRLVVVGAAGEVLIPLASEICTAIDLEARRITIEPPEGLLDLNRR
jgi:16S rRNA processing protein RimM